MSFVHLHTHSEFSLLDGAIRVGDLVDKAIEYKMPAVAITDHGNMFAAVNFFKTAHKEGIKPIIGEEFYVNPDGMDSRHIKPGTPQSGYHLTLLAQNETGWKNIMRLSSDSYTRGFYYKPKIDMDFLEGHAEGIIALSGCLQGEIPQLLLKGDDKGAKEVAIKMRDLFGQEKFYIELMNHGFDGEIEVLPKLIQLARDLGIGLVATNDAHYLNREDAEYHDILLAVGTKKLRDDKDRTMRFLPNQEIYFKSPQEMRRLFADVPEACDNTLKIADMIDFKMDIGTLHFPEYDTGDQRIEEYLRVESEKGMAERYGDDIPKSHWDRLEHELNIINEMGFPGYFAICADFTREARNLGVRVGPGRGSGGGSIVAYAMGITDFDPMQYNLLFERFLNPERKSMPDFDIDFADDKREEVIEYVKKKYGNESVAHVISFGTMKAKAAVKDVGRALGKSFDDMNTLSKLMPDNMKIEKALEESEELRKYVADNNMQEVMKAAQMLEGLPRHTSMHAAGIVITPGATTNFVPLFKTNKDDITTQFDKNYVEDLGLLKMDFLGLRTLTVITESLKLVDANHDQKLRMDRIDYTDQDVFKIFDRGETVGVFQFESAGMKRYLMQLHPDSVEDLIAMNALYRPGPMENIPTYIRRKHGEEESDYYHEDFKPILETTHGIMVYQEQIMLLAQKMAGYSLGDADILRRAIGKKKLDVMQQQREIFIKRSEEQGYSRDFGEKMFDLIEKFANYGFNKSHSAAYAILAYQTAYLKHYFPIEFMAANLTSEIGTGDRIRILMDECRRMEIEVRLPSVQKSDWVFLVEDGGIRFGLGAVKMVGTEFVRKLIEDRKRDGLFKDFYDFCARMVRYGLNQRLLEFLITAGALDDFGISRSVLFEAAEQGIKFGQEKAGRNAQQLTFFDTGLMDRSEQYPPMPDVPDWTITYQLEKEEEALGFYLSGHPLEEWDFLLGDIQTETLEKVQSLPQDTEVMVCGILAGWRNVTTKKKMPMATGRLEDKTSSIAIVAFPRDFARITEQFNPGNTVILRGKIQERGEKQIQILDMVSVERTLAEKTKGLNMRLDLSRYSDRQSFSDLINILSAYPGDGDLILHAIDGDGAFQKKIISRRFRVARTSKLYRQLSEELGDENIWFSLGPVF